MIVMIFSAKTHLKKTQILSQYLRSTRTADNKTRKDRDEFSLSLAASDEIVLSLSSACVSASSGRAVGQLSSENLLFYGDFFVVAQWKTEGNWEQKQILEM